MHTAIGLFAGKILHDGEEHMKLLGQSSLDWTVTRSPIMNERGDPSHFTLTDKRSYPWQTVNRASVAIAMVDQITSDEFINEAPFIVRS